jgi:predicted transcriptional regulator
MTPNDAQKAVLNAMYYDEWLTVGMIAMGCGKNYFATNHYLKQLLKEGLVERRYDSELGRTYWKLPAGEALHRASEEVRM